LCAREQVWPKVLRSPRRALGLGTPAPLYCSINTATERGAMSTICGAGKAVAMAAPATWARNRRRVIVSTGNSESIIDSFLLCHSRPRIHRSAERNVSVSRNEVNVRVKHRLVRLRPAIHNDIETIGVVPAKRVFSLCGPVQSTPSTPAQINQKWSGRVRGKQLNCGHVKPVFC